MDILTPPTPTSVYRYYDHSDILIYVGITSRGTRRQAEHNAGKEWWKYVARQEVEHFNSRPSAERRERELIRAHTPPFNVQHNPAAVPMRTAYLAFRDVHSEPMKLREAVRAMDQRLSLDWHVFGSTRRTQFRTRLVDSALALTMELPDGDRPKVYGLGKAQFHRVKTLERHGPLAIITVDSLSMHPILDAYAAVRFEGQDQRLTLRNLHIRLDHSDPEHCTKRCRQRGHAPKNEVRWVRPDGEGRSAS